MFTLPRCALALLCSSSAVFAAASNADSYIDLRLGGGVVGAGGYGGNLTLIGGAVGYDTPGARRAGQTDAGIALGVRLAQMSLPLSGISLDDTDKANLTGGSLLVGFGFWIGKHVNVETLFQAGMGYLSSNQAISYDNTDGDYTLLGGEVNVLYSFRGGLQLGVSGGYNAIKLTVTQNGQTDDGTGNGLTAGAILGYRF